MKKQVFNPYLPLYEYIPDGEPHLFNGRVYVYGSHDQFGAFQFCHNPYVTWSAPEEDLSDWRYEGVILKREEDPDNKDGKLDLYAPDVTQGPDGRFYIYYAYDWLGKIGVAVCDTPCGEFKFLGHVKTKDGVEIGTEGHSIFHFDPGVLTDEDGRVYLYSGFGATTWFPQIKKGNKPMGCYCMELESDMVTIKEGPVKVMNTAKEEDIHGAKGHEFFEASSIRKINGMYYLVYSSINGHELCYATSSSPFGPFKYGGVIISNGDVGYQGRSRENALYPLGNNHGGLVKANGQWYIFYHRHTNYTNTDRQGLAEKVEILEDGSIPQVEMTSCGLNDGPLKGEGTYPASICCCLIPPKGNVFYPFFLPKFLKRSKTYITQSGKDSDEKETQYIHNVRGGTTFGYKYFDLSNTKEVALHVKGKFQGKIRCYFAFSKEEVIQDINTEKDSVIHITLPSLSQKEALFFTLEGKGSLDIYSLELK